MKNIIAFENWRSSDKLNKVDDIFGVFSKGNDDDIFDYYDEFVEKLSELMGEKIIIRGIESGNTTRTINMMTADGSDFIIEQDWKTETIPITKIFIPPHYTSKSWDINLGKFAVNGDPTKYAADIYEIIKKEQ